MHRPLKVLISAYGCEPHVGSEQGIGWNWSLEVARRGNQVWVITRSNNKKVIENYFKENGVADRINFVYYDLPHYITRWKPYMSVYIYYELWQRGIMPLAKKLDEQINFDLIHYLTFGVFRQNTFLYKLNKPLYIGPLGGGEQTPGFLNHSLPVANKFFEKLRNIVNKVSLFNPYLLRSFDKAATIYVRTGETGKLLPAKYHVKTKVTNDIGAFSFANATNYIRSRKQNRFNVLFVGRLIHWKGPHLAIKAFKEFHSLCPDSHFTLIGKGSFKNYLRSLIRSYHLTDSVTIIEGLPQNQVFEYYKNADVFLFPTLHESGGAVIYEAMSFGLPTITLKINSAALIFKDQTDTCIPISDVRDEKSVVRLLANKLSQLYSDEAYYRKSSESMIEKAKELSWQKIVGFVYDEIEHAN